MSTIRATDVSIYDSMRAINKLEDLVEALNKTNWSSWQSTATFSTAKDEAERLLIELRDKQNADR